MLTESLVNRGVLAADFCLCSVTTFSTMEKKVLLWWWCVRCWRPLSRIVDIYTRRWRVLIVIICYSSRAAGLTNIKDEQRQKTLKQYYFSACAVVYGCYAVVGGNISFKSWSQVFPIGSTLSSGCVCAFSFSDTFRSFVRRGNKELL